MTFKVEQTAQGKPCIVLNGIKYRQCRTLKSGEITWRCLGRTCGAAIRSDAKVSTVSVTNAKHTGNHPVTQRRLSSAATASPTASPRSSSPSLVTPHNAPFTPSTQSTSSTPSSSSTLSTPTQDTPSTSTTPSTQTPSTIFAQSNPSTDFTPSTSPLPFTPEASTIVKLKQLEETNSALAKQLEELKAENKSLLDHTIESDMRLLTYTDKIFVDKKSIEHKKHQDTQTDIFQVPCPRCKILKEETIKITDALRIFEEENKLLKLNANLSAPRDVNDPFPTKNQFEPLSEDTNYGEAENIHENKFQIVKRKSSKNNRPRTKNQDNKTQNKNQLKHRIFNKNNGTSKHNDKYYKNTNLLLPFKKVAIYGDSHARGLAALIKNGISSRTEVTSFFKPGAGIQEIVPIVNTAAADCSIVIAGTNDVSNGNLQAIYRSFEPALKQLSAHSRTLVVSLTTRHDLSAEHPLHRDIMEANNYLSELCARQKGAIFLDVSHIERHHHTKHGLHLRPSGKLVLAGMITQTLHRCRIPRRAPGPASTSVPAQPEPSTSPETPVITPGEHTFAEVVGAQPKTKSHSSNQNQVFLGNPALDPKRQ